jgi:hypothetical protein
VDASFNIEGTTKLSSVCGQSSGHYVIRTPTSSRCRSKVERVLVNTVSACPFHLILSVTTG